MAASFTGPLKARFFKHVRITDACWEWLGSVDKGGYGHFKFKTGNKWIHQGAHCVSWYIHYGIRAHGLVVCHTCDNRSCVRPEHLFLGTHQDNTDDMITKGRGFDMATIAREKRPRGEAHGRSKLTAEQVKTIRQTAAAKAMGAHKMARIYGVSKSNIQNIIKRKIWRDLD